MTKQLGAGKVPMYFTQGTLMIQDLDRRSGQDLVASRGCIRRDSSFRTEFDRILFAILRLILMLHPWDRLSARLACTCGLPQPTLLRGRRYAPLGFGSAMLKWLMPMHFPARVRKDTFGKLNMARRFEFCLLRVGIVLRNGTCLFQISLDFKLSPLPHGPHSESHP